MRALSWQLFCPDEPAFAATPSHIAAHLPRTNGVPQTTRMCAPERQLVDPTRIDNSQADSPAASRDTADVGVDEDVAIPGPARDAIGLEDQDKSPRTEPG
jgi:hypothetical protein